MGSPMYSQGLQAAGVGGSGLNYASLQWIGSGGFIKSHLITGLTLTAI